jgi:hypothetical protein
MNAGSEEKPKTGGVRMAVADVFRTLRRERGRVSIFYKFLRRLVENRQLWDSGQPD